VGAESVRCPGHSIRTRLIAEHRRPHRPLHAREELAPGLGFRGEGAYQGHRGQAWAGIGRGKVGDGDGGHRPCMQRLGVHAFSLADRLPTAMASSSSALLQANEGGEI
jgi:hypothetical protein